LRHIEITLLTDLLTYCFRARADTTSIHAKSIALSWMYNFQHFSNNWDIPTQTFQYCKKSESKQPNSILQEQETQRKTEIQMKDHQSTKVNTA